MEIYIRLEAKWIIPVSSPPIEDGVIIIRGGRILFIGKEEDCPDVYCDEIIDCQHQIVMPGLINPHTHLSLSGLKGRIREGIGPQAITNVLTDMESRIKELDDLKKEIDALKCIM